MKKFVKIIAAIVRLLFAIVVVCIGFILDLIANYRSNDADDEDSSGSYVMGNVFNYNSRKFDKGDSPDGWYDDW